MQVKKIDILREHLSKKDYRSAILLASSFPRLGAEKQAIMQAREALLRPDFQRQLGRDVDAIIEKGRQTIIVKYA